MNVREFFFFKNIELDLFGSLLMFKQHVSIFKSWIFNFFIQYEFLYVFKNVRFDDVHATSRIII